MSLGLTIGAAVTAAILVLAVLGGVVGVLRADRSRRLEDRASWEAFAAPRGLAVDGSIHGSVDGIDVRIGSVQRVVGQGRRAKVVTATRFEAAVPAALAITPEPCDSPELATGDRRLDGLLTVEGGRALLGAAARAALLRMDGAGSVSAGGGWLALEVMEVVWSEEGLQVGLDAVLGAAKEAWLQEALGRHGLVELALRDPSEEVRWRAAVALLAVDDDAAKEAAPELAHSPVTAVRCAAHLVLGRPGALLVDPDAPESARMRALAMLDPGDERHVAGVVAALEEGAPAAELVGWVLRHGVVAAQDAVVARLGVGTSADRAAAAEAVAALGRRDAETALIDVLEGDEPARTAAARALGVVGGSAAAAALEPWTRATVPEPMRSAAVAALQAVGARSTDPLSL